MYVKNVMRKAVLEKEMPTSPDFKCKEDLLISIYKELRAWSNKEKGNSNRMQRRWGGNSLIFQTGFDLSKV